MDKETHDVHRNDIMLLRVIAVILILLNHSIGFIFSGIIGKFLHELFDIGIPLFLLISGFCYGNKEIDDRCVFFLKRFIKIAIPTYIVVVVASVLWGILYQEYYSVFKYLIYAFNLEGIILLCNLDMSEIRLLGPLWFVTVIMICYIMVPLLQKIKGKNLFRIIAISSMIFSFVIQFLTGFRLFYFSLFIIGYYFSKYGIDVEIDVKNTTVVFLLQIGRVILNNYEEQLPLSLYLGYACVSFSILGIWLFIAYLEIYAKGEDFWDKVCNSKVILWIDKMSLYIYLVQFPILGEVFFKIGQPWIAFFVWLILVALFSVVLKHFTEIFDGFFTRS